MKHLGWGIKTLPLDAEVASMLFHPSSQDSSAACDFQNDIRGICHAEFVRDE